MKLQIIFRPLIVFFGAVAVGLHLALFLIPEDYSNTFLYIRYIIQGEFYHNLIFNVLFLEISFLLGHFFLEWSKFWIFWSSTTCLDLGLLSFPGSVLLIWDNQIDNDFFFSLLIDLGKFMTVLFLFLIGFSMLVTAMNTPFFELLPEVKVYLEMFPNILGWF